MNRDVERVLGALKADGFALVPEDEAPTELGNHFEIERLRREVRVLADAVTDLRNAVSNLNRMIPTNPDTFRQLQFAGQALVERSIEWRLKRLEATVGANPALPALT